jgi:hypothetical protein
MVQPGTGRHPERQEIRKGMGRKKKLSVHQHTYNRNHARIENEQKMKHIHIWHRYLTTQDRVLKSHSA